jgi:UDP-N-acetylmuramyl pentapeptide phosphotransferase/UDP-N-acetylglucosamine-1-phosphate transferase
MSSMGYSLVLGLAATVATYVGVARFRRWAEHRRMLDLPNERSSHTRPTPRGGGLVIAAVALLGALIIAAVVPSLWSAFLPYAAGAILVAAVSWFEDLHSVPRPVRFAAHLLGAAVAIMGLGYWRAISLPLIGTVSLGWWGVAATTLWIVGFTNAYNFMDGTDGIAGSQALVAGLGWAMLGWTAGQPLVSGIGLLIASCSLGFLGHNWPPARIFMGDVGSAFLGYTLAILPLMYDFFDRNGTGAPVVGLLLVWPFVFDAAFTFVRRLLRGENVFAPHRSHLYQRMTSAHSGHALAALIYAGLAAAGCVLAQVWSTRVADGAVSAALVLPALCLGLWIFAAAQEHRLANSTGAR